MMGERRGMQEGLFYGFSLGRRVSGNRLLRKIDRFVDLSEVDRALRSRSRSRQGPRNRKDRGLRCLTSRTKEVEMLFAHLKRILRLDRLRLRGPSGAKDEFLLAPQPKTSGNWRSSSPFRRPYSPH